ncbi:unnamed protein product [Musa hybrid cultivar]
MCSILEKPHRSLRPRSAVHISVASPDLPRPPLSSAPCFASICLSHTAELPSSSAVLGTLREMVEEGKGELQKDSGEEETGLRLPTNRHGNLSSASSDARLKDSLQTIKSSKNSAVVYYGASWCRVCTKILPAFCKLSNEFKNLMFVYADIDECPETTQSIRYTPTFHFYRDGERVDEMLGAGEERLHDRLWLHS